MKSSGTLSKTRGRPHIALLVETSLASGCVALRAMCASMSAGRCITRRMVWRSPSRGGCAAAFALELGGRVAFHFKTREIGCKPGFFLEEVRATFTTPLRLSSRAIATMHWITIAFSDRVFSRSPSRAKASCPSIAAREVLASRLFPNSRDEDVSVFVG